MVAGKVRVAMGLQKSPSNRKPETPPHSKSTMPSPSSTKSVAAVFSRSFGLYFPRSPAQVQPRPPDVTELLRLIEELQERESLLKTELLEFKLLKESASLVPVLENEIANKDSEIEKFVRRIETLEAENERLKRTFEIMEIKIDELRRESESKVKNLETEVSELKKALLEQSSKIEAEELSSQGFQGLIDISGRSNLIKNLKRGAKSTADIVPTNQENAKLERVDSRREDMEVERPRHSRTNSEEMAETSETLISAKSRQPRVPKPPPKRNLSSSSSSSSSSDNEDSKVSNVPAPPPPPPPPKKSAPSPPLPPPFPAKGGKAVPAKVRRVPEVVEFYHSLMRRDSRRDSGANVGDVPATANARDMIGEIENRSAHLLAIKTDVETQGDFIRFLIKEVESAAFTDIEDVVPFVKWLDDELSYLVDERAVLKHFEWPEQKADALREAAFGYCDLKKLESEASSFRNDLRQPCGPALKKMQALFEKLEHGIKLASVKLAMKCMKRVSAELEMVGGGPEEEELIVQGVRFAFRVHQFAGGFDVETMRAFQELRDKARSCHIQCQNHHQQRLVVRSTPC
ncbi:hypothetical protein RJ641_002284 [Dillenia turbinata]|uniref:Protein CHUP1, chloroplastic n=1 Tax=Dillenia turbinata TaxID=194707 RepID=A0AAN8VEP2_9MAGN